MNRKEGASSGAKRRVRRGVIGILSRGRELLLIRRADVVAKGGFWCFPGGHLERGETAKQAVQRELEEELGLKVIPSERVGSVRVLDSLHVLAVWRVTWVEGALRPSPSEVAEVRWFTPDTIRGLHRGIASNDRVLEMLGL